MELNSVLTYLSLGLLVPTTSLFVVIYALMFTSFAYSVPVQKRKRAQRRVVLMLVFLCFAIVGHLGYINNGTQIATLSLLAYSIAFLTPLGGMEILKPAKGDWQSRIVYVSLFLPLAAAFFSSIVLARN